MLNLRNRRDIRRIETNFIDTIKARKMMEVFEMLTDHPWLLNKPLNKAGKTALHFAVEIGSNSITYRLIKNGANIFACDKAKRTPLQIAINRKDHKFLQSMVNAYCEYQNELQKKEAREKAKRENENILTKNTYVSLPSLKQLSENSSHSSTEESSEFMSSLTSSLLSSDDLDLPKTPRKSSTKTIVSQLQTVGNKGYTQRTRSATVSGYTGSTNLFSTSESSSEESEDSDYDISSASTIRAAHREQHDADEMPTTHHQQAWQPAFVSHRQDECQTSQHYTTPSHFEPMFAPTAYPYAPAWQPQSRRPLSMMLAPSQIYGHPLTPYMFQPTPYATPMHQLANHGQTIEMPNHAPYANAGTSEFNPPRPI